MKSLIRHLSRDKKVALMLLISSLIIGVCALAPALFVIIVLNKLKRFTEKFRTAGQLTAQEYKKLDGAGTMIKNMRTSSVTSWILDWPFVLSFLIVLIFINWTAAVITAIFMIILNRIITWKTNLNLTQDSMSSVEILITGLLTLTIIAIGALMIMQGRLDIGTLIGSNILAARALQGTNKYTKAKEFIQQRDRAVSEIIKFIK